MHHQNPKPKAKITVSETKGTEADGKSGKSLPPPAFAITAKPLDPTEGQDSTGQHELLLQAGLTQAELAPLAPTHVAELHRVATKYPGEEWTHVHRILSRHRMDHGLDPVMNSILGNGAWSMDPQAESLGNIRECRYRNSEGEDLKGHLELVREGNDPGVRATVPYGKTKGAFGTNLILNKSKTTTHLGRLIDEAAAGGDLQVAVDAEAGTNYLRYQPNFKVGKNTGGGNVLSIRDWSLEKNVEWLKAAIRRGDVIEFVSDPRDLGNIFYKGDIKQGLTVTGKELGILLMHGLAPAEEGRLVVPIKELKNGTPSIWKKVVKLTMKELKEIKPDGDDHEERFENQTAHPDQKPIAKTEKSTSKIFHQTNFFGGTPDLA